MSKNKKTQNLSKTKKQETNLSTNDKIKKHHFILWLILLFPVGLYKSFKYKILPKWANILLTVCFSICILAIIDMIIYPSRILDNEINKEIKEYDVGTIFTLEQYDVVEDYYIYDLITSNGRYDVYFTSNYEIKAIKQIDKEHKDIFVSDDFKYKDVYSEIIRYLNNDSNISLNIEEIIDEDFGIQKLKIDGEEYTFVISLETISTVQKNDEIIYENSLPSMRMPEEIYKRVTKQLSQTKNLLYVTAIDFTDENYSIFFYTEEMELYQLQIFENGRIKVKIATSNKLE